MSMNIAWRMAEGGWSQRRVTANDSLSACRVRSSSAQRSSGPEEGQNRPHHRITGRSRHRAAPPRRSIRPSAQHSTDGRVVRGKSVQPSDIEPCRDCLLFPHEHRPIRWGSLRSILRRWATTQGLGGFLRSCGDDGQPLAECRCQGLFLSSL